jgi:hypothetical protein
MHDAEYGTRRACWTADSRATVPVLSLSWKNESWMCLPRRSRVAGAATRAAGLEMKQLPLRGPWVRRILVRHHASGSAFSRSRPATGMAFPSVSWRHTEPLGAVVPARSWDSAAIPPMRRHRSISAICFELTAGTLKRKLLSVLRHAQIRRSRRLGTTFPTYWTSRAGQKPRSIVCAVRLRAAPDYADAMLSGPSLKFCEMQMHLSAS